MKLLFWYYTVLSLKMKIAGHIKMEKKSIEKKNEKRKKQKS